MTAVGLAQPELKKARKESDVQRTPANFKTAELTVASQFYYLQHLIS
jgi:hypothetical protein